MDQIGGLSIRAVFRGVGDGWSLATRHGVHGFALQLPGGSLGCGGEPLPEMNWACVDGPDGAGEAVRRFAEALKERGLPGVFSMASWVRDEADEAAEDVGLTRGERPSPLMALDLRGHAGDDEGSAQTVRAGFEVRTVEDEAGLEAVAAVLADAYEVPLERIRSMTGRRVPVSGATAWYVGYAGGQPASACAVTLVGAVVGVYGVGTAQAQRRRGAAQVTIGAALAAAGARGARVAGLISDTYAVPLYESLGFTVVDRPSEWVAESRKAV